MEPPARSPFSSTTTSAPSSRARAAATSPAIPAPATSRSTLGGLGEISAVPPEARWIAPTRESRRRATFHQTLLDQREAGLVLHVLDLDSVRAPDEDRVRVGRVDDVGDLDPLSLRFVDVIVRGIDLEAEVIEQRPVRLVGIAGLELDEGATDGEPPVVLLESELRECRRRLVGIGDGERHVVE